MYIVDVINDQSKDLSFLEPGPIRNQDIHET